MSMQDIQHEYAEDHPWQPEPVAEPYTGRVEAADLVYTVAEAASNLAVWQRYQAERPTSKQAPAHILHWERVLAKATAVKP